MNDNTGNSGVAWMKFGPFDLSAATIAFLEFYYWNESELNYDYFKWCASGDGINFNENQTSGTTNPEWTYKCLNLDSYVGDNSVWIAFCFSSDFNNNYKGAFVDDVYLWAYSDTTPPSAVTNLAVDTPTSNSLRLTWTAPGDDGNSGTASQYDIRYSTSAINAGNWESATPVPGEPAPLGPGNTQSYFVTPLNHSTTYYFAIKTADEVPNLSNISNSPNGTTDGIFVSGRWKYRNRDWISTNPTDPASFSYANQFLVYLKDANGNRLKDGVTDADGYFSLGPVSYTGNMTLWINASMHYVDGQNYNTNIIVHTDYTTDLGDPNNPNDQPHPNDIFQDAYSYVHTGSINSNNATLGEIEICRYIDNVHDRDDVLDAYWMKDDMDKSFKYVLQMRDLHPHAGWNWPLDKRGWFVACWQPRGQTGGAYWWGYLGGYIKLDGWCDDNNPWRNGAKHKNITLHETGHRVMDAIYEGSDNTSVSWSEGWADFWPCVVTNTYNLGVPSYSEPPGGMGHDLEAGYDIGNEKANIACSLWDLYDIVNNVDETFDQFEGAQANNEMGKIWSAFVSQHDQPNSRNGILDF